MNKNDWYRLASDFLSIGILIVTITLVMDLIEAITL